MNDGIGQAGRRIAGRYRLIDTVGQGGMGIVWRAQDEVLGRTVAVKQVFIPEHLPRAERDVLRERVMREARAAARLHDPAAVTVFDVVEEDGSPYLVMELVDASTLAERVRDEGPVPPREAARIGVAVLGALDAAHRAGIVHRDVKPGNVMVCANGRVLLTDFGIASTQGDSQLTQTGLLLGSPAYIAPERARGGIGGPPSDLWALGGTLFTAVEGVPPFEGDGALQTLTAVVEGRRRPFRRAGALAVVLDALLAEDPAARPTAAQARRMLEQVVAGGTPSPMAGATGVTTRLPSQPLQPQRDRTTVLPAQMSPYELPPSYDQTGAYGAGQRPGRGMRNGLIAAGVLLLVAAVTVGVLAATGVFTKGRSGVAGRGNVPAGWTTYTGPQGWQISYPPAWQPLTIAGGTSFGADQSHYVRVTVSAAMNALTALQNSESQRFPGAHGRPPVALAATPIIGIGSDPTTGPTSDGDAPTSAAPTDAATSDAPTDAASSAAPATSDVAAPTSDTPTSAAPTTPSAAPTTSIPPAVLPTETLAPTAPTSAAATTPSAAATTAAANGGYDRIALKGTSSGNAATSAYWEFTQTVDGVEMHYLDYAIVDSTDTYLYTVLFVAPESDFGGLTNGSGTFDMVRDSFSPS